MGARVVAYVLLEIPQQLQNVLHSKVLGGAKLPQPLLLYAVCHQGSPLKDHPAQWQLQVPGV